ncbi:MAG: hypothetical protein LAQ69_38895, partial [Acidobacteriia bacterium]|nr:hypothetical protein [Terriglobia bacterium]
KGRGSRLAACTATAVLRDTLAALNQLPRAAVQFRKKLPPRFQPILAQLEGRVRKALNPNEAYSMVPGRDPENGQAPARNQLDIAPG